MKKHIYIITSIILLLITMSLYYTYAIDVTVDKIENSSNSNADLTFNINLKENNGRSITVKAGETKYFDIFVTKRNHS